MSNVYYITYLFWLTSILDWPAVVNGTRSLIWYLKVCIVNHAGNQGDKLFWIRTFVTTSNITSRINWCENLLQLSLVNINSITCTFDLRKWLRYHDQCYNRILKVLRTTIIIDPYPCHVGVNPSHNRRCGRHEKKNNPDMFSLWTSFAYIAMGTIGHSCPDFKEYAPVLRYIAIKDESQLVLLITMTVALSSQLDPRSMT